ncbi:MAG TPA: uroporphyrinogen-III synthase, partial [Bacteroidia bacterium]|nr:uroporphyrinogen-III synthase [Bacteroidia bacterium]
RTVQQQFENAGQLKDLTVYETVKKINAKLPEVEVIVFTSPSNVESYFEKGKIKSGQQVIAMGKSTEKKLQTFGVEHCILPESFDEIGLVQAVFAVSAITSA